MKKKAMILGAGIGQIPFINLLKERGCYVIAVSVKGNYPGFEIADKCYYVDTRDKEAILEIAREEGIDIITQIRLMYLSLQLLMLQRRWGLRV